MMPVFAMVVVFIGLDSLTAKGTEQWWLFFVILGAIPIVSGILGLFVLKDKPNLPKNTNPNFGKELIYGFRPSVIKKNKMLYIALASTSLLQAPASQARACRCTCRTSSISWSVRSA